MVIIFWFFNILVLYLVILLAINNSNLRYLKGWLEQMNDSIETIQIQLGEIKEHLKGPNNLELNSEHNAEP